MSEFIPNSLEKALEEILEPERYYGCAGCGREGGEEHANNWCDTCGSYKYFGWIEVE